MKIIAAKRTDESGAILLMVLGLVALIGLLLPGLLRYAATNERTTVAFREVRAAQFAADGAVDAAITRARFDTSATKTIEQGACLPSTTINSTTLVVDCLRTGLSGSVSTVTVRACRTTGCTSSDAVLEASVQIDRSLLGTSGCPATPSPSRGDCIPVLVSKWSVKK